MSVVALRESGVTVDVLISQIKEGETPVDGLVCVVRRDGCWQTCWTTGVDLGSLSMAAMKLFSDVTVEMHRPGNELREFGSAG